MDALINFQLNVASRLEKAYANYKKSPKERIKVAYLQTRLDVLQDTWKEFTHGHQQLLVKCVPEALKENDYFKNDVYSTTEEKYIDYKAELMEMLAKLKSGTETKGTSGNSVEDHTIKLPRINIPTFSGNYTEWMSFRDLFMSMVHNNNKLDNVQKLHYLKSLLTGEAEQLLRHIAITGDNYQKCWELLKSRYNNKKYLSNCIIKRLLNQKTASIESASFLKEMIDTSTDCLNALSNLGVDVSSWDIIVIHILTLKLDGETRKQWELYVTGNMPSDDLPTFSLFKDFIVNRFRALEFVEQKVYNKPQSNALGSRLRSMHVASDEQPSKCSFCSGNHKLHLCDQFITHDSDARREFVQSNGICFNCLGINHTAKTCKCKITCKICKRRHHSLLHPKTIQREITANVATEDNTEEESVEEISANTTTVKSHSVLLATALVDAEANNGECFTIRALLDQGSQASFVTEATVQLLRLRKTPARGLISGVGGDKTINTNAVVQLKLKSALEPGVEVEVKAHVLKSITGFLPGRKVVELDWLKTTPIKLADPQYHSPNKIDLLLGAEVYGQIIKEGILKDPTGLSIAQATVFGWVISGLVSSSNSGQIMVLHASIAEENLMLKQFWEIESEPSYEEKIILTEEEKKCEEFFSKTTTRDAEGRYVVKLPFRKESPDCEKGNSEEIAKKRFLSLEKRLNKNRKLKEEYKKTFNEYIQLNHMALVKEETSRGKSVYLPYHEVVREDKDTTKVRIVMNASSKGTNGVSLNDDLMVGPTLQMDLRHIIMRWRQYPVALTADIEKMFRQIKVDEEDANYQRIVWRENPEKEIEHYKILRVLFGTACAPYLAVRCLMQVSSDEGHNFPKAATRVREDFYMDDLLTGCQTVEEGVEVYKEMNELLEKAGFHLQKWSSNSEELLCRINEGCKEIEDEENRNLKIKMDTVIKILGLTWDRRKDSYQYTVTLRDAEGPVTKRQIISDVARLFDPLGWVAPVIITAKVIIQKLWLAGIGWDEKVPVGLLEEWENYRKDLKLLEQVTVPRYLGTTEDTRAELHGFSDASQVAYAAVVYVRSVDSTGNVRVSLVASKTKVAPVKQVSIPRLELCGAVLLTKLLAEVGTFMEIPKNNWLAWTDSTVVLAWLNSHPSRWKTFIANRVSTILGTLEPEQWAHVQSKSNPADVASRGLRPSELVNSSLWFNGPELLHGSKIRKEKLQSLDTNLEEAKRKINTYVTTEETSFLDKYSALTKLIRVVAYCKRFLNLLKPKNERPKNKILTAEELEAARDTCIKVSQKKYFREEIEALQLHKNLKRSSKLLSLNPFLDQNQILRVGGRLDNSGLPENRKHPVIIPKEGHLTTLLIGNAHKSTLHGGPRLMLNFLYSGYWIIGIKQLVKAYVRKCVTCVKNAAVTKSQLMGQLPAVRINPSRPFKSSGVDYAGPIDIRTTKGRGYRAYKGYICLFICMVTRAVHIEVVSDLTSQSFLAAFKRFVARRGHCSDLYSDNGTNFVGAARELKTLFDMERSTMGAEIAETLATNGTKWHFIPPYAPNFGGLWEAAVKSTKYHLKRVIGNATLTYEELSTILAQIEACLNSRPLSRIESGSESDLILTPGHFLVGGPLVTPPDRNFESSNISCLRRWQLTQRMFQNFWRHWSQDYIHKLQQRYKWQDQVPEPQVGDVVLIKEADLPPSKWLYGRIKAKHPDSHNVTRVVTIRTKTSDLKRPTSKLILLPVAK